jgi:hypothetical protein
MAVTGMGEILERNATAARVRTFFADPTSTKTRTTKGNMK